jgi:hypothetical protein
MKLEGDTDKIVTESGAKNITTLIGYKYGNAIYLTGTVGKTERLSGLKHINSLEGLKHISSLQGTKYISDLAGLKHISILNGTTSKNPILLGEASEGWWHIHVDNTYYTVDSTIITVDRD